MRTWWIRAAFIGLVLIGYWFLPISGRIIYLPGHTALSWPQMLLSPTFPRGGTPLTVSVTDVVPWAYVLLTINGRAATLNFWQDNHNGTWTWVWKGKALEGEKAFTLAFYHDCNKGCRLRGMSTTGDPPTTQPPREVPATKLCLVFARLDRDWHGRRGWVVDLTYARPEDPYWGIDALAARVYRYQAQGLRVLVRVDYARGQSIPPGGDHVALTEYLDYLDRLARDARLDGVYAYFLGSGYNAADANTQSPDRPVSPAWYARMFNGYGEPPAHLDNAVQVMRAANPRVRVLVGPVRPWVRDQDGERAYRIDVPWLNYMNTLVAYLDESTRAKMAAGIPLAGPDGFALHVPGRPEASGENPSAEPWLDLPNPEWQGAQQGFRLYRELLDTINAYSTTRGLPVYITSSNTYAPDLRVPPARNYPPGWLTAAYRVIRDEPQVQSLCWFLDHIPGDPQWRWFDLTEHPGRLIYAAEEFEALLREEAP
ncbi:MAG: hypothetical protein Q9O62_01625 [Ardenticatenia bacterium]|nr:hypothetical protein [Ardenticatenia bacterium]